MVMQRVMLKDIDKRCRAEFSKVIISLFLCSETKLLKLKLKIRNFKNRRTYNYNINKLEVILYKSNYISKRKTNLIFEIFLQFSIHFLCVKYPLIHFCLFSFQVRISSKILWVTGWGSDSGLFITLLGLHPLPGARWQPWSRH